MNLNFWNVLIDTVNLNSILWELDWVWFEDHLDFDRMQFVLCSKINRQLQSGKKFSVHLKSTVHNDDSKSQSEDKLLSNGLKIALPNKLKRALKLKLTLQMWPLKTCGL